MLDDGKGKIPSHKYDDAMLEKQWVLGPAQLNGWASN